MKKLDSHIIIDTWQTSCKTLKSKAISIGSEVGMGKCYSAFIVILLCYVIFQLRYKNFFEKLWWQADAILFWIIKSKIQRTGKYMKSESEYVVWIFNILTAQFKFSSKMRLRLKI